MIGTWLDWVTLEDTRCTVGGLLLINELDTENPSTYGHVANFTCLLYAASRRQFHSRLLSALPPVTQHVRGCTPVAYARPIQLGPSSVRLADRAQCTGRKITHTHTHTHSRLLRLACAGRGLPRRARPGRPRDQAIHRDGRCVRMTDYGFFMP